eukprot:CAMPEP_0178414634 /NCGR_PEP_ID=MMETSP0689_2-20121128/23137_1 /TAXON_ID=160604 /ORGANISM="Amphidinium massartii, Strain CS-259" /LENGTH=111 /DNA_ID=CAMNT_0020035929 /DNA_START=44 /DNA_END=380 /DNA_ORIENTATION=-
MALVHTLAANYPEEPSAKAQQAALLWIRAFVHTYPCGLCAREFTEVCSDLPPRLGSRADYVSWWSEAHNRVRADLSQQEVNAPPEELLRAGQSGLFIHELPQTTQAGSNPA